MKKIQYILTALAAASVAALTACGGGTDNTPKSISIDFAAMSGSTPITCASSLSDLGTTNAGGTLSDLRFYVSNVKLVKADGSTAPLTLDATDNFNATKGSDAIWICGLGGGGGRRGGLRCDGQPFRKARRASAAMA